MAPAPDQAVWFKTTQDGDRWDLRLGGAWTVTHIGAVDQAMRALHPAGARRARIDLGDVQALDTAGAWLVYRTRKALQGFGIETGLIGTTAAQTTLIEAIAKTDAPGPVAPPRPNALIAVLARMGAALEAALEEGRNLLGFLGLILVTLARTLRHPGRLRLTALDANMQQTALNEIGRPRGSAITAPSAAPMANRGVTSPPIMPTPTVSAVANSFQTKNAASTCSALTACLSVGSDKPSTSDPASCQTTTRAAPPASPRHWGAHDDVRCFTNDSVRPKARAASPTTTPTTTKRASRAKVSRCG